MFCELEIRQISAQTGFRQDDIIQILQKLKENSYTLKKKSDVKYPKDFTSDYILGRGDQAIVFLGQNVESGIEVAIKISRSENNICDDLTNEFKELEQIFNHDYVVEVYKYFILEKERICIQIKELCKKSLEDELKEMENTDKQYTFEQVAFILLSSINALCEIHANGIIHFNIKPSNILISRNGNYKLADFGYVKNVQVHKSHIQHDINNTITYQSPEQIQDLDKQKLRNATDVYSMGICLLRVIGINIDSFLLTALYQNDFSQIDDMVDIKYQSFYIFIKHFMLQQESDKRYSAFRLRERFMYVFQSQFNKEQELTRLKKQIQEYEAEKRMKNKKYLSFLYYFLSSMFDLNQDDSFLKNSLNLIEQLDLKSQFEQSLFYEQYSVVLRNQSNFEQSLEFLEKSYHMKQQLYENDHLEISLSLLNFSEYFWQIQNFKKCLDSSKKALELLEKNFITDHPDKATSLNFIGVQNDSLGKFDLALEYNLKALKMRQNLYKGDHIETALSLNDMGSIYSSLGDIDNGLEYSLKALKMRQALFQGNHIHTARSLHNVGFEYIRKGQIQQGLKYQIKTMEMEQQIYQGNHADLAITMISIAKTYELLDEVENELEYKLKALNMVESLFKGYHQTKAYYQKIVAQTYERMGDINKANEYFKKSQEIKIK